MSLRHIMLGGCLLLAVFAIAADEPAERPEVRVDTVEGRALTGRLVTTPVRLENEYGTQDIRPQQGRRITIRPRDAENGHDVVELADKSEVRGHLLNPTFAIDTGERIESFSPAALREIKAVAH